MSSRPEHAVRKTVKSRPDNSTVEVSEHNMQSFNVLDGGALIYRVKWPIEMGRYRIWKYRYIALKESWYIDTLRYTNRQKSPLFLLCGNINTIIWLKTGTFILKFYNKYSYVCNNYVDSLDKLWYTIHPFIKNYIDVSCVLQYNDTSMYHPISNGQVRQLMVTTTIYVHYVHKNITDTVAKYLMDMNRTHASIKDDEHQKRLWKTCANIQVCEFMEVHPTSRFFFIKWMSKTPVYRFLTRIKTLYTLQISKHSLHAIV